MQKTILTNAAPGINKTINFQGKMTDDQGLNVADGNYQFIFQMYTLATGGASVWTETVNLDVADGIFQHNLGSVTPLPGAVDFDTDNIFLGITFNSDPDGEMEPRIQLTASPYAFNADALDGLDSSELVQLSPSGAQTGDIAITGAVSAGTLVLSDGSSNTATVQVDSLGGNYTYIIPTTTGNDTFCLEGLANCSGGGGDILNGGNSGAVTIGTNDANDLVLETNDTARLTIDSAGFALMEGSLAIDAGNFSQNGSILAILGTFTNAAFPQAGISASIDVSPSAASTQQYMGVSGFVTSASNNLSSGTIAGVIGGAFNTGTGTVGTVLGGQFAVANASIGTVSTAKGILVGDVANYAGGTVTNATGVNIANNTGGVNNTNLLIGGITNPSGDWSIYNDSTHDNYFAGSLQVDGGLDVTNHLTFTQGSSAIHFYDAGGGGGNDGSLRVQSDSIGALNVQTAGGVPVFTVDTNTSFGRVIVGRSDAFATLLVLDDNTGAGDPTGVNGAMYYNSNSHKFRCYENTAWVDCVSAGGGGGGLFTDGGTATYLTSTTDELVVGGSTSTGAKLSIIGSSDQTQLLVRANATQTSPLIVAQDSAGGELFAIRSVDTESGDSIAIGYLAGSSMTDDTNYNATALGSRALQSLTSGIANVAVGYYALSSMTSGAYNTAIGDNAMRDALSGNYNTAIGQSVLNDSAGDSNTGVGADALENATGSNNTAVGRQSLQNVTGSYNTALGMNTLQTCTSCTASVALGYGALNATTTGSYNVAIGDSAIRRADAGSNNVGVGFDSLENITSSNNTALGFKSGNLLTSGANNVLLGHQAGDNLTTGSNNIVLGYDLDAASATGNNQLNIAGLIQSSDYTTGAIDIATSGVGAINIGTGTSTGAITIGNYSSSVVDIRSGGSVVLDANGGSNYILIGSSITVGAGTVQFQHASGGTGVTRFISTPSQGTPATNSLSVRTGSSSNDSSGHLNLFTGSSGGTNDSSGALSLQTGNGNGTNTSSGSITMDVGSATGTVGAISIGATNASSLILGRSGMTTAVGGNLSVDTDTFFVDSANNRVGIGTNSPLYTFHAHTGTDNNFILRNATDFTVDVGSGIGFQSVNDGDNAYRGLQLEASVTAFNVNSGGYVGIGTATPDSSLHVLYGGGGLDNDIGIHIEASITSADNMLQFDSPNISTGSNFIQANQNGTSVFSVRGDGAVTVGAFAAATGTTVCRTAGGMLAACSSLAEYKEGIEDLSIGGLDTIMQLQARQFEWKSSGLADLGFVAEEVEAINPLLAQYETDGSLSGVKYTRLTALLTQGIQELDVRTESQNTRLTVVENNLGSIAATVEGYATAASVQSLGSSLASRIQTLESGTFASLTISGSVSVGGNLTVAGTISTSRINLSGKLVTSGAKPTGAVLGASSDGKTVEITGNDTAGAVSLVFDDTAVAMAGEQISVNFAAAFSAQPRVNLTAVSEAAAQVRYYVEPSATGFKLIFIDQPLPGETYSFNYFVVQ